MPAEPREELELDELWTFVAHRRRGVVWRWLAHCRRTRPIVAYALGPRDDATARRWYARIPAAYRHVPLHTAHLESSHNVIPPAQHQATYAGRGSTNHVERFNNTLRQRVARLVRKTLSFSKCPHRHELVIRLFLHRYNMERLTILN